MAIFVMFLLIFYWLNIVFCETVTFYEGIFNEEQKIVFYPDSQSEYFGYSVLLSELGLHVGAPKAKNRSNSSISTGLVFVCPLNDLDRHNVTCAPLITNMRITRNFYVDDMWFGATMGVVKKGKLWICAPRSARPYKQTHLLSNGVCYVHSSTREVFYQPLKDMYKQAFSTHNIRPEYDATANYYAYAQLGMSLKVSENNHIIMGAPGLSQWTGGIVDYKSEIDNSVLFKKQQVTNPFYTYDLQPDDYFGYSVETGVFEENDTVLYVGAAPRSKNGLGQVLIFDPPSQETQPYNIRQKIIGPQIGAYFGASLCCVDINNDGRLDLLIGAPTFVKKDGGLNFDQGAVFVYLNHAKNGTFSLEESGSVLGSEHSGSRFGMSIASLGDVDGDGYDDIAVGAPWENEGSGVVYIYQGSVEGLKTRYAQRILMEKALGFGMSISIGYDVDNNFCNDVAIGAHASQTTFLLKCVPTIKVEASIKVPDLMDLPEDATNFTAYFCVTVRSQTWQHIKIDFKATKLIDPELNRASMEDETVSVITIKPGIDMCDEHILEVNRSADFSKPILVQYLLEPSKMEHLTRLSEDSKLQASFLAQMIGDCGKDLLCTPLLKMTLEPLDSPYIPGANMKLGARITIVNIEEPAYGGKLHMMLPLIPIRVPRSCTLEKLNMTCNLPAPLHRNETAIYEIELQYEYEEQKELKFVAELKEPLYMKNVTEGGFKELELVVTPKAKFAVNGKSYTNATIIVSREKLDEAKDLTLIHFYEVTNFGPSDWYNLNVTISLSEQINVAVPIVGCTTKYHKLNCIWTIFAGNTKSLYLPLHYNLSRFGELLQPNNTVNLTSRLELLTKEQYETVSVKTTLILEPPSPIWPLIAAAIGGLLILIILILIMYKLGFFKRQQKEELKRLLEETAQTEDNNVSGNKSEESSDSENQSKEPSVSGHSAAQETKNMLDLIELDSD